MPPIGERARDDVWWGSIRETVPSSPFATQSAPAPYASAVGAVPDAGFGSSPAFVPGSIRETWPRSSSLTQTAPPPTAMPLPTSPVAIVLIRRPLRALSRVTDRSPAFVTQTEPNPAATATGTFPTGIVSTTWFVPGSMRETVPSRLLATQTAPTSVGDAAGPCSDRDRVDDVARRRDRFARRSVGSGSPPRSTRLPPRPDSACRAGAPRP